MGAWLVAFRLNAYRPPPRGGVAQGLASAACHEKWHPRQCLKDSRYQALKPTRTGVGHRAQQIRKVSPVFTRDLKCRHRNRVKCGLLSRDNRNPSPHR